jgi:hypothetical protein
MQSHYRFAILIAALTAIIIPGNLYSATGAEKKENQASQIEDGWYLYEYERDLRGVQAEYEFAMQTGGMKMLQKSRQRQTGTVVFISNGTFIDPALMVDITIGATGEITSENNLSVSGIAKKNGDFFWAGYIDNGSVWSIEVRGTLTRITSGMRAGNAYDGVYHIKDIAQNRDMLVTVSDGLYVWKYLDERDEDKLYQPWPTLIAADGTFRTELELTTIIDMVGFSKSDFTSMIETEGKVVIGKGLSQTTVVTTSGTGKTASKAAPSVFSGMRAQDGEFTNEQIPPTARSFMNGKQKETASRTEGTVADYPDWYRSLPVKKGFMYAVGSKKLDDSAIALSMAEAVAAAEMSSRVRIRLQNEIEEENKNGIERVQSVIDEQSTESIPYTVLRSAYSEKSNTAYVLISADEDEIRKLSDN